MHFRILGARLTVRASKELLKAVDKDGNSTLSFDEFQAIFDVASLKNVFDEIDVDGSGTIKAFELSLAIEKVTGRKISEQSAVDLLKMIDSDNDGEVNFQEFQDYFAYIPLADTTSVVKHLVGPAGIDFGTDLAVPTPPAADMPLWRFVTAGACGGLCSRTATAPLERLKLEAQINGTRGLYSTAKQILRGEGASGVLCG